MGKRTRVSKSQNRGDGAPWSDLNHHLLSLVMMKLEAIDFGPFSGVCKSWRSLALPNKSRFMASRPPMSFWISERANNRREYSLEDLGGRMFKIRLPKSGGRTCVGLTCGYLVFFGTKPRDFMLMNPITRHVIRFPKVPSGCLWCYEDTPEDEADRERVRAILVFSPSISAWVFVVLCRYTSDIWFSIAGKGEWNWVSAKSGIIDLHDFKGKIYAIDTKSRLYELGLDPEPKLTKLKTKNILESDLVSLEFVSSGENLYALECEDFDDYEAHKLDFGEMEWVSLPPHEKRMEMEEYAFFVSDLKHSAAIKTDLGSESGSWLRDKCKRSAYRNGKDIFFNADIWYFPHDCLKVNLKHQ